MGPLLYYVLMKRAKGPNTFRVKGLRGTTPPPLTLVATRHQNSRLTWPRHAGRHARPAVTRPTSTLSSRLVSAEIHYLHLIKKLLNEDVVKTGLAGATKVDSVGGVWSGHKVDEREEYTKGRGPRRCSHSGRVSRPAWEGLVAHWLVLSRWAESLAV